MKECVQCTRCVDDTLTACPVDGGLLTLIFEGPAVLDGKYRVERRLGQGGMGSVYQVLHLGLQRLFALKLVRTQGQGQEEFFARFRIEAQALGQLKHPNIVDVTDFGIDPRAGGLPYLVMEYLEGSTLSEYYRAAGRLPLAQAVPILAGIARAVDFAHANNILHRDLKPSNVFLSQARLDGSDTPVVKILDFGLARITSQGVVQGTSSDKSKTLLLSPADRAPVPASNLDESETLLLSPAGRAPVPASNLDESETLLSSQTDRVHVPASNDLELPTLRLRAAGMDNAVPAESRPGSLQPSPLAPQDVSTERVTVHGTFFGTPGYIAPELLKGQDASAASDVYAFGVLAYAVVVGHQPFEGRLQEVLNGHRYGTPPTPSDVQPFLPPHVNSPLLAALEKEPGQRPASATAVVSSLRRAAHQEAVAQWRRQEIPRRLVLSAVLSSICVLPSMFGWQFELLQKIEAWTLDSRFLFAASHPPDERILLISLDEASLQADPTPLTARADEFGQTLTRVFEAGARGVAIDLLFPEKWSRSQAFATLILQHADRLTLGVLSADAKETIGPESLGGLITAVLGPQQTAALFGYVNLDMDADGTIRRARTFYHDTSGHKRDSWAGRAVKTLLDESARRPPSGRFLIDFSSDWRQFSRLSWKDLPAALNTNTALFQDRLVLVGAEFSGSGDVHRVPNLTGFPQDISGLVLQALTVDTILAGMPLQAASLRLTRLGVGLAVGGLLLSFLCVPRGWVGWSVLLTLSVSYMLITFGVFYWERLVLPLAGPVGTLIGAAAVGWWLRRELPHFPHHNHHNQEPI